MTRRGSAGLVLVVGLAVLGTGCSSGTAPEATAHYTRADLSKLVLSRADAPPGAQPVSSGPRSQSLAQVVTGDKNATAEKRALAADGFVNADQASFVAPNVAASGGASLFRVTTSAAALFPSAANASQAVGVFSASATQGPKVSRIDATSLAPDAVGLVTSTTTVVGEDYAFIWSIDRLALVVIVATDTTALHIAPALAIAAQVGRAAAAMGAVSSANISGAVLQASAAPAGTQYVASRSGPKTASQLAGQASEATQLSQLGYQSGYQTLFEANDLPTVGGGQAGAALIASFSQLYSSAAGAQRAYEMQVSGRLRLLGKGLQAVPTRFGDQSTGFSFKTSQGSSTLPGVLIAWRRGNAVLAVYAVGPGHTASISKVNGWAEKVDRRAAQISS